ncbi:MAG: hypothetical protein HAW67_07690 [Endozoicomonadaceae bacterium]|nr:hypothetical protein [Endozoicomonadaceae bacterium]
MAQKQFSSEIASNLTFLDQQGYEISSTLILICQKTKAYMLFHQTIGWYVL